MRVRDYSLANLLQVATSEETRPLLAILLRLALGSAFLLMLAWTVAVAVLTLGD